MEKQNTRERLETRIRNTKRLVKSFLYGGMIGGFALMGFGVVNASRSLSNIPKPEAYKNYIDAQTTLTLLETEKEKSLDRKLNFQKNIDDLIDNAIIDVKEDIVKMEENPEIKNYKSETGNVYKNAYKIRKGALLIYILGMIGGMVSTLRWSRYRNQLRDLDAKVEGE